MSAKTDTLRELYLDVAGAETITESQEEEPSREPIDGETAAIEADVSNSVREDGLADALEGTTEES